MVATPAPRQSLSMATFCGLLLALALPTALTFFTALTYGTTQTRTLINLGIPVHWANLAAVIAVVILAERHRPASIGLQPLRWWTLPLGLLAGLVIVPVSELLANALGSSADARFVGFLQSLPVATRVLLVLTAGIFEETLFRGYALERLASLLDNKSWAAVLTVAVFTLAHIPAVGLAHLLPVFIVSVLITLLYLWRRDLVVNIVAHVTIDGVGLLLIPLLNHHGAT